MRRLAEEGGKLLRQLLVGAVDVARAVLGAQAKAVRTFLESRSSSPALSSPASSLLSCVRDGGDLRGVGGGVLALQRGGDERRERLVVERLMGILREQLRQLRADLLPEGEHRVALRLLCAELSAGLEHADLRLRVRTQLVRLAPRVGDDLFRLAPWRRQGSARPRGSRSRCRPF